MSDTHPTSRDRAAVLIKAAFEALNEAGGDLRFRDILAEMPKRVPLTARDREVYEKSGNTRWKAVLHLYSIDCVKAGFIKKSKGRWYLTPEGRGVLDKPGREIVALANKGYKAWKAQQPAKAAADDEEAGAARTSFLFESAEADARAEIEQYVKALGPYELQDLVAALLRAMGYSTPFVAPKGPDGGTDILAYRDPLGTETPHIRVQVKHRADKASREEVAALRGVIRSDREVGLFVASGGFTPAAVQEARQGTVHIELVDLDGLLELWMDHYEKLAEDDKGLLRLRKLYLLSPE